MQAVPQRITLPPFKSNEDEKYREQFLTRLQWRRVKANP